MLESGSSELSKNSMRGGIPLPKPAEAYQNYRRGDQPESSVQPGQGTERMLPDETFLDYTRHQNRLKREARERTIGTNAESSLPLINSSPTTIEPGEVRPFETPDLTSSEDRPGDSEITERTERELWSDVARSVAILEKQLRDLSGDNWRVKAETTDTGYQIGIIDEKNKRFLDLQTLLKNPEATETYKKLIGSLELIATQQLNADPGNRKVKIYDSEGHYSGELPRESELYNALWKRAAEKAEPAPITEKKESKLKGLFDQGRKMMDGLKRGVGGWFQRRRQVALSPEPIQVNEPSASDEVTVSHMVKNETSVSDPDQSFKSPVDEVLSAGQAQVDEVVNKSYIAPQMLEHWAKEEAETDSFKAELEDELFILDYKLNILQSGKGNYDYDPRVIELRKTIAEKSKQLLKYELKKRTGQREAA